MIDTHAHIYLDQFESDLPQAIERSQDVGIERILINTDY